jgi:hypothetical protein
MKLKYASIMLLLVVFLLGTTSSSATPGGTPLGSAFTYQGRLDRNGRPYTGACDFQFKLFDAAIDGGQFGPTLDIPGLPVSNGLFLAQLSFGSSNFSGDARWLEVAVNCPGDPKGYTTLGRQELTATPYALYATAAPWNGLTGVPAGFADNLDNDTTYSAGNGLSLDTGTSTFSIDPDIVQQTLKNNCVTGAIHTILNDGSVFCNPDATGHRSFFPQPQWPSHLYGATNPSNLTSITVGIDGLGLFSYYEADTMDLMVAHCTDPQCLDFTISPIDTTGDVGKYNSITVSADGKGLISYLDNTNGTIKVAKCLDLACTSAATIHTITGTGVYRDTSITVGYEGRPMISYYDAYHEILLLAICSDQNCGSASQHILDGSLNGPRIQSSIVMGWDMKALISYYSSLNDTLRIVHCDDYNCSSGSVSILDTNGGYYNSLVIGEDGFGLISYTSTFPDYSFKVAHCTNLDCSNFELSTIDSTGIPGDYNSITIGEDGLGIISYTTLPLGTSIPGKLQLAHCNDTACSGVNIVTLETDSSGYEQTAITVGTDGLPLIAYFNIGTNEMRVIHCTSVACVPYFRRR